MSHIWSLLRNGNLEKKVILKISDYRSALIQGKFLAKKGIWISEYRVESGLNLILSSQLGLVNVNSKTSSSLINKNTGFGLNLGYRF